MNFCSSCGNTVIKKIPEGDNRERHVCEFCVTIHYENPRVIAGVLPVYGDQILLCRRAIEPRHGFWTLPAGELQTAHETQNFVKNLGIVAGLLVVSGLGAGRWSLDSRR